MKRDGYDRETAPVPALRHLHPRVERGNSSRNSIRSMRSGKPVRLTLPASAPKADGIVGVMRDLMTPRRLQSAD